MSSSISSSDAVGGGSRTHTCDFRWVAVFVLVSLGLVLTYGFGFLPKDTGFIKKADTDRFWAEKVHTSELFDVVVVGDSRVYRGFSPSEFSAEYDNTRVLNYGFSSGGMGELLLETAEAKLDPESKVRTLVLGITPHSLTERAAKNDHLRGLLDLSRVEVFNRIYIQPVLAHLAPVDIEQIPLLNPFDHKRRRPYSSNLHPDGWMEVATSKVKHKDGLERYEKTFGRYTVDSRVSAAFIGWTEDAVKRGLKIVGFRPPTCDGMLKLEQRLSGFSEEEFSRRFSEAGGIWIDLRDDASNYQSYDGSHLTSKSARRLSRVLASRIKSRIGDSQFARARATF